MSPHRAFTSPLAAVIAFAFLLTQPCAADVINGSFEDGSYVDNSNHVDSLPVGSTAMTGWTVVSGELAWGRNDNPFVGAAATSGSFALDLTGFHDSIPYAGVTQTVSTTPGTFYLLSFDLISDESDSRYKGPMSITASADSTSAPFTFTAPAGSTGIQSGRFTLPFVASNASTVITLQGTASGGGQFLGLDNVVLAVPEPSSIALAASGAVVLLRRRRAA